MATAVHPPEVEATLNRLTSYKNVQGVLILSRPNGIILQSAGTLFALSPAATTTTTDARDSADEVVEHAREDPAGDRTDVKSTTSELARNYAKAATSMVEAVGSDVRQLGEEHGDDLRFLRVRTKRHELMITPHEQYLLVVVQDPTT